MHTTLSPFSVAVLGDAAIDQDHVELVRLVDELGAAPPAGWAEALRRLHDHASRHFAVEDADLRHMKDGNAKCHLDEHASVLASLREVLAEIAPAPDTPVHHDMVRRLLAELRRWLPEHVQAMDAAVAVFRTKRRLGGAPVVISRRPAGAGVPG